MVTCVKVWPYSIIDIEIIAQWIFKRSQIMCLWDGYQWAEVHPIAPMSRPHRCWMNWLYATGQALFTLNGHLITLDGLTISTVYGRTSWWPTGGLPTQGVKLNQAETSKGGEAVAKSFPEGIVLLIVYNAGEVSVNGDLSWKMQKIMTAKKVSQWWPSTGNFERWITTVIHKLSK